MLSIRYFTFLQFLLAALLYSPGLVAILTLFAVAEDATPFRTARTQGTEPVDVHKHHPSGFHHNTTRNGNYAAGSRHQHDAARRRHARARRRVHGDGAAPHDGPPHRSARGEGREHAGEGRAAPRHRHEGRAHPVRREGRDQHDRDGAPTNERVQKESELYIRADKDARYGIVAKVVAAARSSGVKSLNLLVEPEIEEEPEATPPSSVERRCK